MLMLLNDDHVYSTIQLMKADTVIRMWMDVLSSAVMKEWSVKISQLLVLVQCAVHVPVDTMAMVSNARVN